jgi:hypothetical protein
MFAREALMQINEPRVFWEMRVCEGGRGLGHAHDADEAGSKAAPYCVRSDVTQNNTLSMNCARCSGNFR